MFATLDVRQVYREFRRRHPHDRGAIGDCTSDDEREFLAAVDRYKRENRRPFPCYSELLLIAQALGYRRVAQVGDRLPSEVLPSAAEFAASQVPVFVRPGPRRRVELAKRGCTRCGRAPRTADVVMGGGTAPPGSPPAGVTVPLPPAPPMRGAAAGMR